MAFLGPPSDDLDHIILLVIVIDQKRTRAILIDWHSIHGPRHAQIHPPQTLEARGCVPNLLIPLQEASFMLATGTHVTWWKDILSGSASGKAVNIDLPATFPGASPSMPIWASWAKPMRSQAARHTRDTVYLAREDGLVLMLEVWKTTAPVISNAGTFDCHMGSAFASLGGEGDPDILCVAGESSSGRIVSIGNFSSIRRIGEMTREDTMRLKTVELLPNWASCTGMLATSSLHSSRTVPRDNDSVIVTSGRQPYGTITELRRGVEARSLFFVALEDARHATDMWAIPDTMGSIVFLLSGPLSTRLFYMDADGSDISEIDTASALSTSDRTLAAGFTWENQIVQVTPRGICASTSLTANFEDTIRHDLGGESQIVAASIVPSLPAVITAEQRGDDGSVICCYSLAAAAVDRGSILCGPVVTVTSPIICVTATAFEAGVIALAATHDGQIALVHFRGNGDSRCFAAVLPASGPSPAACDHIEILHAAGRMLAVCGLRDGRLATYEIDAESDEPLREASMIQLGASTVKIVQQPDRGGGAVAIIMTGINTYRLSWDGPSAATLTMDSLWITDTDHPDYAQGSVAACAWLPDASFLSSDTMAGSIMFASEDHLIIALLTSESTTVPRHIPTSGTPNRVVYAASMRQLVCSGLRYGVRSRSPRQERRQIWPTIDFIPDKRTKATYVHDLQPGDRVHALLPWSVRGDNDKTYSSILVGGSYIDSRGERRGRVSFLQPLVRDWEVVQMRETRYSKFPEDVTALALYDETHYVACAGRQVILQRYHAEQCRWEKRCPPFKLASAGVKVSVETRRGGNDDDDNNNNKIIVISTACDSIIVLSLLATPQGEHLIPTAMGPHADLLITHITVPSPSDAASASASLTLASTKYAQLLLFGIPSPSSSSSSSLSTAPLLSSAQLPRSLTSLLVSPPPSHRGPAPLGVTSSRVLGCATDGTVCAVATLHPRVWPRLFWLQRLVEWSPVLSPHLRNCPPYRWRDPGEEERGLGGVGGGGEMRACPIGLREGGSVLLWSAKPRSEDWHLDGDVLARCLRDGGWEEVVRVMRGMVEEGRGGAAVRAWMREHVEAEIVALDGIVEGLRAIDGWV
jgi:hypothetical protein